jgi:hypothetical protein
VYISIEKWGKIAYRANMSDLSLYLNISFVAVTDFEDAISEIISRLFKMSVANRAKRCL